MFSKLNILLFSSLLNIITASVGRWVSGSVGKWSVVGGSVVSGFNQIFYAYSYYIEDNSLHYASVQTINIDSRIGLSKASLKIAGISVNC